MPRTSVARSTVESLQDVTRFIQTAEGFHEVVAALRNRRGASIDGAWGSASGLTVSALGLQAPQTTLVALAHPRDIDGWIDDLTSFAGVGPAVFPAWDDAPGEAQPVDEITRQRLRILRDLHTASPPRFILTTIQALLQPVPDRAQLQSQRLRLEVNAALPPDEIASWLVKHGFQRVDAVEMPGDFSRRGGILDVFPPDAEHPLRIEFFGDALESLRPFSLETQRSIADVSNADVVAANLLQNADILRLRPGETAPRHDGAVPWIPNKDGRRRSELSRGQFTEHFSDEAWTVLIEPDELREQGRLYLERVPDARGLFSVTDVFRQLMGFPNVQVSALPLASVETTYHLRVESVERLSGNVSKLREELDTVAAEDQVVIACASDGERKRLGEILLESETARSERLRLVSGRIRAGFRLILRDEAGQRKSAPSIVVLGGQDLFQRQDVHRALPRRRVESRAIDSFLELAEGDLVVHVAHGIACYLGMQLLEKNGLSEEHLILQFREGVRVYVPASKIDLVQKYVGGTRSEPELSSFGGYGLAAQKARAEAAVLDLASEMVDLQAVREGQPGEAYPPDSDWQAEFEATFAYEETPDQLTTLAEIKRDLQRPRPMDRLICGDVGYGKTELAVRAAFKAADNGKQVAVLVPTTVLAEQHFRTFRERFAEYPFVVDSISRFRSPAEQRDILDRLAHGGIDVIVGTHRLVSSDVRFKDLGLVIIDEEQRFGVDHKERLKRLRHTVDVLTMTATPIPRTLHLALLGIRDISNLETPPPDRLAIETRIARFDPDLIRYAILREMNREGQVYFVHNRVHDIRLVANRIQAIVPEARIAIAHGQMPEHELEQTMVRFVRRESDILVATTIIESGLDIPNVNTIFIDQADTYGLADLHQLRGRVGRYKHRAYAYLLLDADRGVTPTAARRLKAIEEFTALGAGFKIALRDLEIRGAGNILGTQQSGHIAAVGYELYCQLLETALRQLKHQPVRAPVDVNVELPWKAFLPRDYVPGQRQRIQVYRRLARLRRPERIDELRQELRDRFGVPPEPAEWFLRLREIRLLAARWRLAAVYLEPAGDSASLRPIDLVIKYRHPGKAGRLAHRSEGRLRLVDSDSAYLRLATGEREPEALYGLLKALLRAPASSL